MAVVTRKYKSKTTHYAANRLHRKFVYELIGPVLREAEVRDRAMKREIKDGTYKPPASVVAASLGLYIESWLSERTNAYAVDERRIVRLYVTPRLWLTEKRVDEVTPADTAQLVKELRAERKADGTRRLSDKSISNVLGVLKLVFGAAELAGECLRNPVKLPPRTLKRAPDAEKEIYSTAELVVLTRHHAIPWPIRVLNALCLLAGLREGEACGRRWKDLTDGVGLNCMRVHDQYAGRPLKTERSRHVPIHPELARILTAWAEEGFELYTGRRPDPEDFIVPNISPRAVTGAHTRSSFYKAFIKFADAAGVRPRSLHSTRHTFISLARRGGARKDHLERVTHNARGDMVDRYTHTDWAPLCEAVSSLNVDALPHSPPGSEIPGNSRGISFLFGGDKARNSSGLAVIRPGSIPGASTEKRLVLSQKKNPLQHFSQHFRGTPEDLKADNRRRKRRFLSLQEADAELAAPGLAACRTLDAAYAGDEPGMLAGLEAMASALGVATTRTVGRGGRRPNGTTTRLGVT